MMNKTIIFNLASETNIIRSSHIISNYKETNPYTEITLCIYKDFLSQAKLIAGVNEIITIDRDKIGDFFENPLFSDSFGINEFHSNIKSILDTRWDSAINLSNDNVSAYLASAIECDSFIGTKISEYGAATTSNSWATYLNYALYSNEENPISQIQAKHQSLSLDVKNSSFTSISTNEEMTIKASQNFDLIRKRYTNSTNGKIVILSLCNSGNKFSIDAYTKIIQGVLKVEECIPVLAINGTDSEKNIVNILNSKFGNALISINADIQNVPAVLMNSDLVIGTNNTHTAIADTLGVPTVELISNNTPANFNSITSESYLLSYETERVTSDTEFILNHFFDRKLNSIYTTQSKIYQLSYDSKGPLKKIIAGRDANETKYRFERDFIYHLLDNSPLDLSEKSHYKNDISFFEEMKNDLTESTRVLLATIRSIKQLKDGSKQTHIFFKNLDQLVSIGRTQKTVALPVRLFEGYLENLGSDSLDNLVVLESLLYKLKDDYREILNLASTLLDSNEYKPVKHEVNL